MSKTLIDKIYKDINGLATFSMPKIKNILQKHLTEDVEKEEVEIKIVNLNSRYGEWEALRTLEHKINEIIAKIKRVA